MKRVSIVIVLIVWLVQFANAATYHVDINGSDASGDGSSGRPWRTIRFALSNVPANQGHTIKISAGTFIEQGPLNVPLQVSIEGEGTSTVIKAASSFYYKQTSGYATDKILFSLSSSSSATGNQSLKNFTIDGDSRKLYGGVIIKGRTKVLIDGLTIRNTGFVGIWLWSVKDSRVTNVTLRDCAWEGTGSYSTGSICLANLERVEIDHIDVNENFGAAVKAMGQSRGPIYYCKIHDNRLSTSPQGRWVQPNGSTTPSIVLELFDADLIGNELYNNYFDANVSLATLRRQWNEPRGIPTIRVYNNVFDCITRANGRQYALELSIHDVEIDHNYFYGGLWGISDWGHREDLVPFQNWKIHHNVFYKIEGSSPGIIRSETVGLRNLEIYNNTVEFTGQKEISFLAIAGRDKQ